MVIIKLVFNGISNRSSSNDLFFLYVYFMKQDGFHFFVKLVNDWKGQYHTDLKGNIIFQNKTTMANVVFTHNSMHKIQNHSRGVEQLPQTIVSPDEIWSKWADPKTQRIVLRSYIAGKYVVLTEDGQITDAFLVKSPNKYRDGCLIIV